MTDVPSSFTVAAARSLMAVETAERNLHASFPDDYKSFLATNDGGEGFVGEHYLVLWRAHELYKFNAEYEFPKYASAYIGFGGDGGGEAFAFDIRYVPYRIAILPLIGMSNEDAIIVADSFSALIERMKTDDLLF